MTETLWHYTCEHSRNLILESGRLLPAQALVVERDLPWQARLVWLTNLASPHPPAALAIDPRQQTLARCDRTAFRFRVLYPDACIWWPSWRREHKPPDAQDLESAPGARPAHWWVSSEPVPVVADFLEPRA